MFVVLGIVYLIYANYYLSLCFCNVLTYLITDLAHRLSLDLFILCLSSFPFLPPY